MEIVEKNTVAAWKKGLKYIYEKGKDFTDKEERVCREVLNLVITVKDPQGDVTKPIEILNSFKKWVYPPFEEIANFMLTKRDIPGYYYTYGSRAFKFGTLEQIDKFVIPLLKKDLTSRRAVILFYNPSKDSYLYRKETPGMISADFKVRDNKLHVTAVIRSSDVFFGFPANIYQLYILQEYVRKKLGVEPGNLTVFSNSAHIFEDNFEDILRVISE
ncbi:MAG: thymidylate synthase [Leptospiraceae bacterium]|nr:thymidylate synthase [Leptospiraceae bacterium]